jgi:hypothetical protein
MRQILGAFAKLRKATNRFVLPVCLPARPCAYNNPAPTKRIAMNFDRNVLFENLS